MTKRINDRYHGEDGKFKPGNPGNPIGRLNRPSKRVKTYTEAIEKGVKPSDWKRIINRAVKDAIAGDWRAREWLARYIAPVRKEKTLADLVVQAAYEIIEKAERGEEVPQISLQRARDIIDTTLGLEGSGEEHQE